MINEELQEKLLSVFDKRFQDYNTKVLEELGNVIKQWAPRPCRNGRRNTFNFVSKKVSHDFHSLLVHPDHRSGGLCHRHHIPAKRQQEENTVPAGGLLCAVGGPLRPAGGLDRGTHQLPGAGAGRGLLLQRPQVGEKPPVAGVLPGVLRGVPAADMGRPPLPAAGRRHDDDHRGTVGPWYAADPAVVSAEFPSGAAV